MKTSSTGKKKLLVIDDDRLVLRSLESALSRSGYEVDIASSGLEGIEKAANNTYDLIIADIRMPKINGIEAAEKIRESSQKQKKAFNLIFLTGYADDDQTEKSAHLGASDFILKPIDIEKLLDAIKRNIRASKEEHKPAHVKKEYDPTGRWQFPGTEFVYEKVITLKSTNMEGNVYFSNYFEWQGEVREICMLSHPNFAEESQKSSHVKMITHSSYQRFIHEAFMGDVIQIKMNTREIKHCNLVLVFKFFNKRTGTFLAEGWQRVAFTDVRTGKVCLIPNHILDIAYAINEEGSDKISVKVN